MPPSRFSRLAAARTPWDFREALAALDLEAVEAKPLGDWALNARLGRDPRSALARLMERYSMATIGDLLRIDQAEVRRLPQGALIWAQAMPVLLQSLAQWVEREGAAAVAPRAGFSRPQPGMPPEPLEAWARERGVQAWLDVGVGALADHLPPYERYLLWSIPSDLTIRELICAQVRAQRRYPRHGEPSPELQQAAIRMVEGVVQEAEAGRAWEQSHQLPRQPAADDPHLLGLWERLSRARSTLRAEAEPRQVRDAHQHLTLEEDPPVLIYVEPVKAWCGGGRMRPRLSVDLRADPATVRCDCPAPERGRPDRRGHCSVALSALDACLDLLSSPDAAAEKGRRQVRAALAVSPWERALGELDAVLGRPAQRDDKGRQLGWRLTVSPGEPPRVQPALCKPYATKPGLRTANIGVATLKDEPWRCETETDREILAILPSGNEYLPRPDLERRTVRIVELLAGHPRVLLGAQNPVHVQVRCEALVFRLRETDDGGLELQPVQGGQPVGAAAFLQRLAGAADGRLLLADAAAQRVTVLEVGDDGRKLLELLGRRGERFPAEAAPGLLARLPALAGRVSLDLSSSLGLEEVPAEPRLVLRLEAQPDASLRLEALLRPAEDAPAFSPGEGAEQVWVLRAGGYRIVRRALHAEEAEARAQLAALELPVPEPGALVQDITDPEAALGILAALRACEERCPVEWAGAARPKVTRGAQPSDLSVSVGAQRDWFGMGGQLEVDGHSVPFADVMQAVLEGRRFVRASGQAWVQLSRPFLERLRPLSDHVEVVRGNLRVTPLASAVVEDLEAAGARLDAPSAWRGWLERLRASQHLDPAVPASLVPVLRPYQADAFRWLVRTASWSPGACLADDMGLGKTVQALALLVERAPLGPALVVAPTSVGFGWIREAERFTPGLRLRLHRGADRARHLVGLGPGEVLVTSYTLLAKDEEALAAQPFATFVLDEAQAIKNPDTLRARAAQRIQAQFHLALTGTPVENRTSELWSIFRVAVPGLLGSWGHFRSRFAVPIERDQDDERRRALAAVVRPFVLRRLKREVEPDLPPRTEVQLTLDLDPAEKAFYEQLRLTALAGLTAGPLDETTGRIQVLAALTRLRQAACHPRLVDPTSKLRSTKLQVLRERIAALRENGHRALIFSQFTTLLGRARRALERDGVTCRYLDGSLTAEARQVEVDTFQRGEADVFLISLKAGGTGLNLTAATYVFHLDPWWNPAVEDQATDRAHRIGQEHPVTVYRMVSRGTVEEAILDLHASKRALVEGLLEGTGAAAKLDTNELVDLLRFGGGVRDDDPVEADEPEGLDEPDDDPEGAPVEAPAPAPARLGMLQRSPAPAAPILDASSPRLDLRASFHAWRTSDSDDLAASSLAVYTRALQRLLAWAESRGATAADAEGVRGLLAAYRAEIDANTWPDSRSTGQAASAAVGRWVAWLDQA
ncbi:MAG: DEAD/DEAH box helicase [Pseudomonadota bacterium]